MEEGREGGRKGKGGKREVDHKLVTKERKGSLAGYISVRKGKALAPKQSILEDNVGIVLRMVRIVDNRGKKTVTH